MNNYYRILIDSERGVPISILADQNTMCVEYNPINNSYKKISPTKTAHYPVTYLIIILINPTDEDLTYLTLLGIEFDLVNKPSLLCIYNTLCEKDIYYPNAQ